MKKKYFNDAFIGNENITASFSKYGELHPKHFVSLSHVVHSFGHL